MTKKKWKYSVFVLTLFLIIFFSIRIVIVNQNRHFYETYRVNVDAGDTMAIGGLEFTFGKASIPIITKNEDLDKAVAIYKLPIKVTKKDDSFLEAKNKFGIYEKYKDYINLPLVSFDNKQKQSLLSTISSLKEGETISFTISTDFILGDFYYYYDDFAVHKPAYIVIAGSPSKKGIPLYYYRLQHQL
jgi:hypothetical protein